METFGGGWLGVFQQRVDFKLILFSNWTEYRNGLGVIGKADEF